MSRKQFCRLCAKSSSSTVHIFEDAGKRHLLHLKILQHLNIKVTGTDPLSKYVCIICIGKLDYVEKFRSECRTAQVSLRRKLYKPTCSSNEQDVTENYKSDSDNEVLSVSSAEVMASEINENIPQMSATRRISDNKSASIQNASDISVNIPAVSAESFYECCKDEIDVEMEVVEEDEEEEEMEECEKLVLNSIKEIIDSKIEVPGDISLKCTNYSDRVDNNCSQNCTPSFGKEINDENSPSHFGEVDVCNVGSDNNDSFNSMATDDQNNYSCPKAAPNNELSTDCNMGGDNDKCNEEVQSSDIVSLSMKNVDEGTQAPVLNADNNEDFNDNDSHVNDSDNGYSDGDEININDSVNDDNDDIVDHNSKIEEFNDGILLPGFKHSIFDSSSKFDDFNLTDEELQVYSSLSQLYFRRQDKEELGNDPTAVTLKVFQCVQNLYEGKCSFMPYFIKWPGKNKRDHIAFKCFSCNLYYSTNLIEHMFEHLCCACQLCSLHFRQKRRYEKHMSNHHFLDLKNGKISCNFCDEKLSDSNACIRHQKKHCEYRCGFCSFKSMKLEESMSHYKSHHFEIKDCEDCVSFFNGDESGLKRHVLKISENNGFVCKCCGIGFHTGMYLKLHYEIYGFNHGLSSQENSGNFDGIITAQQSGSSNIKERQKTVELIKLPRNDGKSFFRKIIKLFHDILDKKVSCDQLPVVEYAEPGKGIIYKFRCPVCCYRISNNEKYIFPHIKIHLCCICHQCEIIFRRRSQFMNHMRKKQCKLSTYKCNICENVTYSNLSEYMSHLRDHLLKKICEYCPEVFTENKKKHYHILREHKDKLESIFCDQCGKRFVRSGDLKSHMARKHDTLLKKMCSDCGKFINLSAHVCSESKNDYDQKFICAYCSKVFRKKHSLIPHIQAHMNFKSFRCNICDKGFSRSTSLQKHVKDMHSERRWKCGVGNCYKSFTYQSALEDHMKKRHRIAKSVSFNCHTDE